MGTALVTGATAGIGAAFCDELAARGHDLVLVARDLDRLELRAAQWRRLGVTCEVLPADLADRNAVATVAARVADAQRPVDLLVNNAGFAAEAMLGSDVADQWRAVDVMVGAVTALSHAAANAMLQRGRGAIVNVSSVAGWTTAGVYAACKSYVTVLTESLHADLRDTGVTATALCPGFTRTEFHDRAGYDMTGLPAAAWLDARKVVRTCLDDVAAGKALSVPGPLYKAAALAARLAPRGVIRAQSAGGPGGPQAPAAGE